MLHRPLTLSKPLDDLLFPPSSVVPSLEVAAPAGAGTAVERGPIVVLWKKLLPVRRLAQELTQIRFGSFIGWDRGGSSWTPLEARTRRHRVRGKTFGFRSKSVISPAIIP